MIFLKLFNTNLTVFSITSESITIASSVSAIA